MALETFKVFAVLLAYPEPTTIAALDELYHDVLVKENFLEQRALKNIDKLIQYLKQNDLITLQENYVALFDRSRRLSLHLFEHVHGDSRARGPAMVELAETYRETGFVMKPKELPDYLPVFLEYLASLSLEEAKKLLAQPINLIAALGEKLKTRDSHYHYIFDAILSISGIKADPDVIKKALADDQKKPQTKEELDAEWEEKPAFSGDAAADCNSCALSKKPNAEYNIQSTDIRNTNKNREVAQNGRIS